MGHIRRITYGICPPFLSVCELLLHVLLFIFISSREKLAIVFSVKVHIMGNVILAQKTEGL